MLDKTNQGVVANRVGTPVNDGLFAVSCDRGRLVLAGIPDGWIDPGFDQGVPELHVGVSSPVGTSSLPGHDQPLYCRPDAFLTTAGPVDQMVSASILVSRIDGLSPGIRIDHAIDPLRLDSNVQSF